MKIEVGKKYNTRGGCVANLTSICFLTGLVFGRVDGSDAAWDHLGKIHVKGEHDDFDLVSEHVETPTASQIGGDHYTSKSIQPIDYIHANSLGFCEGNVVKYVTRHKDKNGKQDIEKAIHYLQLILQQQYS